MGNMEEVVRVEEMRAEEATEKAAHKEVEVAKVVVRAEVTDVVEETKVQEMEMVVELEVTMAKGAGVTVSDDQVMEAENTVVEMEIKTRY